MAQPVPNHCPFDGGSLEVTEVTCQNCDVQIRGHFTLGHYDRLDTEQRRFLEAFLRCRGVIRDMEAVLGISYPTVKARLETLLQTLGFQDMTAPPAAPTAAQDTGKAERRKAILAAIDSGQLSADAGLKALQDL